MTKDKLMPERILRIGLKELAVVRVNCTCGTVTELPMKRFSGSLKMACAGCNADFYAIPSFSTHLRNLANGIVGLCDEEDDPGSKLTFQFSVSLPDKAAS